MKVMIAGGEFAKLQVTVAGWGYQAVTVNSGLEAWDLLQDRPEPMVLLLDWLLPGLSGAQLCQRLKQSEEKTPLYVILLTGPDAGDNAAAGFSAGADDCLAIPFSPEELHSRLALGNRILDYQESLDSLRQELVAKDDQLSQFVGRDSLTGVGSRAYFQRRFAEEWRRLSRAGQPLSLVVLDMDYFKCYNETYGHGAGDECLKLIARTISSSISRGGDFVARGDGAEFMIVLPNTDSLGALVIAEAIRVAVAIQDIEHIPAGIRSHVTVSAGTATVVPDADVRPETLLAKARQSLFLAKAAGKNAVRQTA